MGHTYEGMVQSDSVCGQSNTALTVNGSFPLVRSDALQDALCDCHNRCREGSITEDLQGVFPPYTIWVAFLPHCLAPSRHRETERFTGLKGSRVGGVTRQPPWRVEDSGRSVTRGGMGHEVQISPNNQLA